MIGFKIIEIAKVLLDDILVELHFNIENSKEKKSFSLMISDDGETIIVMQKEGWVSQQEIQYEAYSTTSVGQGDELAKLLETEIAHVQYGVGKTLGGGKNVIYYFKMKTNENEFLFLNNGDAGGFFFENIEEILSNDIYGYTWADETPVDHFSE